MKEVMETPCVTPDVVFHGTPFAFDLFRSSPSGIHFGNLEQAAHRLSLMLAKLDTTEFERLPTMQGGLKGRILQCRLRVSRVKQVKDVCHADKWQKAIKHAKAEGFDGLVYENWYEMPGNPALSWVVFDPAQIEIIGHEP